MADELSSTVHRLFAVAYSSTACLAILVSVSLGVVTDYWKDTIDGCILYADIHEQPSSFIDKNNETTSSKENSWVMMGSDLSVCNYATFTPVFFIFVCILCLTYHLRHLFCKHCWRAEESDVKTDFWEMIVRILVVLSIVMALLALIVACILTHGHDYTCGGLRRYVMSQGLSPWLGISSAQIHELFDRLDCGFFYSALDHGLKIGSESAHDGLSVRQAAASSTHGISSAAASTSSNMSFIDSNAALEVAMATGWFQFVFWFLLACSNVWLANRLKVQMLPENMTLPTLPTFFNKE